MKKKKQTYSLVGFSSEANKAKTVSACAVFEMMKQMKMKNKKKTLTTNMIIYFFNHKKNLWVS